MPFQVQEQRYHPQPVTPNATGGYSRAQRPDPNSAMEVYKRANPAFTGLQGAYGAPQMPGGNNDQRAAVSEAGLSMQADQTDRDALAGWDRSRQVDVAQGQMHQGQAMEGNFNDRWQQTQSKILGGNWRPMLQALKNLDVGRLRTGAVGGGARRGFLDTQQPELQDLFRQKQAAEIAEARARVQGQPTPQFRSV